MWSIGESLSSFFNECRFESLEERYFSHGAVSEFLHHIQCGRTMVCRRISLDDYKPSERPYFDKGMWLNCENFHLLLALCFKKGKRVFSMHTVMFMRNKVCNPTLFIFSYMTFVFRICVNVLLDN